jgi:fructokinase
MEYVTGLGEVLWDMLPGGRKLGGAPSNFAFHAGQFGLDALAVSAVGTDDLGAETLSELRSKGLDYIIPRVDFPTGTVGVTLDEDGVPSYSITEGVAWDNIPFTPEIAASAAACRCVCFGSLAQRSEVSRATIRSYLAAMPADSMKILDINLRGHYYSREVIDSSLQACNILKINDEELAVFGRLFSLPETEVRDRCMTILQRWGLMCVVLTCGVGGSYVFSADEMSFFQTPSVMVADTVGAGDSFTGAFAASLLHGLSLADAHRRAVDVSAYVCTQSGAMPPLPERLTRF